MDYYTARGLSVPNPVTETTKTELKRLKDILSQAENVTEVDDNVISYLLTVKVATDFIGALNTNCVYSSYPESKNEFWDAHKYQKTVRDIISRMKQLRVATKDQSSKAAVGQSLRTVFSTATGMGASLFVKTPGSHSVTVNSKFRDCWDHKFDSILGHTAEIFQECSQLAFANEDFPDWLGSFVYIEVREKERKRRVVERIQLASLADERATFVKDATKLLRKVEDAKSQLSEDNADGWEGASRAVKLLDELSLSLSFLCKDGAE